MTLEEHIYTAKQIKRIRKRLMDCYCGDKKFKKIYALEASRLNNIVRILDMMKSTLDSSYHRLITDEQFKKLGHIYYGD